MQTFLLPNGGYRNVNENDIAAFLQENPGAKQVSFEDYSIAATDYAPLDQEKVKEESKKLNEDLNKRQELEYSIKNNKGEVAGTYSRSELESFYPNLKNDTEFQRYINKYAVRQADDRSKAVTIGDPYSQAEQLQEVEVVGEAFPELSVAKENIKEKEEKEAENLFSKEYNPVEIFAYNKGGGAMTREKDNAPIRKKYLEENGNDLIKAKEAYLTDKNKNRLNNLIESQLLIKEDEGLKQKAKTIAKTGEAIEKENIALEFGRLDKLNSLFSTSVTESENIISKKYNTQAEVDEAKSKLKNQAEIQKAILDKYNKEQTKIDKLYSGLQDEAELYDIASKDYGKINNLVGKFIASTAGLTAGALAIPSWISNVSESLVKEVFGESAEIPNWAKPLILKGVESFGESNGIKTFIDDLKKFEKTERGKLARPTDISEGYFGSWVADLIGNQLPQFAVMLAAPEASLGLLSSSAAGNKFLEMNEEIAAGKEYTPWQMLLAPTFIGAAEYLTEKVTLGQAKAFRNFLKSNPTSLQAAQGYLDQNLKGILANIPKEGAGEGIATLSENATNKFLLGQEKVNLLDNVPNSVASGMFMSAVMYQSPLIGKQLLKEAGIIRTESNAEIANINNLIAELEQEQKSLDKNSEEWATLNDTKFKLIAKQNKIIYKDVENIDKLTEEDRESLKNIATELTDIQNEAAKTYELKLSDNAKQLKLAELQDRYTTTNERKAAILNAINTEAFDYESFELKNLQDNESKGMNRNQYLALRVDILSSEIDLLEAQKAAAKDPEVKKAIQRKIDVRRGQISYAIPAAMGLGGELLGSIQNAKTLKDVSLAFVGQSRDLLTKLNAKEISQDQYNTQYKALQTAYKNKKDSFTDKKDGYTALQETFENNQTQAGRLTEKGAIQLKAKMMPIMQAIAKRLYDKVPNELLLDKENGRQSFIDSLANDMVVEMQQNFDPSQQSLDKFISNRAYLRANRLIKEYTSQEFKDSIEDSKEAQQIVNDSLSEVERIDTAINTINTAEALGLKFNVDEVTKELLKNYNPDTKSFKRDISGGFINQFKDKVYEFLGKDTKTKKDFSEALRKNAPTLYDVLTVESMRMARGIKGSNPFVEAGMLIQKDGQLEKVAFKNINVEDFVSYFTDPTLSKQARSNRQNRFKEAVTVSIAASQAIDILNTNENLRGRISELNQLKQEIGKNLNKNYDLNSDQFQENYADKEGAVIGGRGFYNKILAKYPNAGETLVINKNNQQNRDELKQWFTQMATYFPREFFELSSGSFNKSSTRFAFDNAADFNEFLNSTEFAKNDFKGDWSKLKRFNYSDLNKSPEKINGAINKFKSNWSEISSQQETNMDVLEYVAKKFETMVADDINNAKYIATFLQTATNSQDHILRMAAPLKAYSNNLAQGMMREEHTMPSALVGNYLLDAILSGNVDSVFPNIRKNYFQVALNKNDDNKLKPVGLNERMPNGWTLSDNTWARYFNDAVNKINGGINPNSIIFFETGKSIAETYGAISAAKTPDAIKAQQQAVSEEVGDKVEFVIDRAIARLTELTGTKGFAIDPFLLLAAKDVSLNVLVGGLRAVKLAYKGGKGLAKAIDAGYQSVKKYMSEVEWLEFARIATSEIADVQLPGKVRLSIFNETGVAQAQEQVRKQSEKLLKDLGIETTGLSTEEINNKLNTLRKARLVAVDKKAPKKKARVFDFDDTLAQSKSNVLYTLPDGTTGKLNATEFAAQSEQLMEAGAEFDFSEFSKVIDGSKGPLAVLAKKLTEAKGDRDIFVLTARPANSAEAIQSFLRSALGISIPLENITGLGDGAPGAKAFWMAEKVAEGYNDLFFADDAPKNVAAVNKILTDLGVKKKVQVAKEAEAPSLEDNMDNILRSKKPTKGSFFRKFNIYVPPGADDFAGLLYTFLGSGKVGEAQMKFFQDNLMKPFAAGIAAYEAAKVSLASDYKGLKKRYKNKKVLKEKILDGLYTKEQAVRAYLYERAGYDLGMNKADAAGLIAIVESDASLKAFAQELAIITKIPEGYPEITEDWLGGNIQTDLANVSNKAQRKMFLAEFIQNKNEIFSDINMKLIKQMHGNDFTDALTNVLERMETGVNRKKGKDKEFNLAMDWINQSVANVMAVNIRSAVLQQLSIVNFMNWSFNNPLMVGKAMANVPQFASDFIELWNSSFLTERRGGLKIEINTADLANSEPGNWFLKTHKKLLELGFKPTQWGDSFAISFGGASWFRNRTNQLIKQGVSEVEAKEQAMLEFQEIAETTQQSSRPDKISRQQASEIGRFILAFANTPLQYARETKKATLDLVNRRGDWKTNASKIVYYGVAQNVIFSALQSALFSLLLSDDEDDEKAEKQLGYFANGIFDGFLRGMGYSGAIIAALKNLGMEYYDQRKKREAGERVYDPALGLIQAGLTISPPLSKKIGDIVEAQKFENWRQYKDVPFYQGFAVANYVSALTNIPLDRAFKKVENLAHIGQAGNAAWQDILLALGWSPYQLDVEPIISKDKKKSKIKDVVKKSTPLKKESLPEGVLGKAHKDGTIQVAPGLSPAKKKEVIAHEKKHIADMKSGKLGYDASNVYWNGNKYPRTPDKKIIYDGVAYDEGHKHLPWEKSANNIKV